MSDLYTIAHQVPAAQRFADHAFPQGGGHRADYVV